MTIESHLEISERMNNLTKNEDYKDYNNAYTVVDAQSALDAYKFAMGTRSNMSPSPFPTNSLEVAGVRSYTMKVARVIILLLYIMI